MSFDMTIQDNFPLQLEKRLTQPNEELNLINKTNEIFLETNKNKQEHIITLHRRAHILKEKCEVEDSAGKQISAINQNKLEALKERIALLSNRACELQIENTKNLKYHSAFYNIYEANKEKLADQPIGIYTWRTWSFQMGVDESRPAFKTMRDEIEKTMNKKES